MDKLHLRESAEKILKNMSETEKHKTEDRLIHNLLESALWKKAKTIGITISQGFEWNTEPIIEQAWAEGKTICVPKCYPKEKGMSFFQIRDFDELEVVYYNLLEPKPVKGNKIEKNKIELLIVPGLIYDKQGYRIGFGGGYYDRFLTDFSNTTVSLLHSKQLVGTLPSESFDIPVNYLITEKCIIQLD